MSIISLSYFIFLFSLKSYISSAITDALSLTSSLTVNQTIISKNGIFELGFFKPNKNVNNYYIGIWYKNIPNQTVVWVANRINPVTNPNSSQLKFSNDGNLILVNSSNHQLWSTETASKAKHVTLLDTSNLVLTDGLGSIVWQSFDHPTDTHMPDGWIAYNKITRENIEITCWESPDNPAPGPFTLRMNTNGSNYGQYESAMLWNNSDTYWTRELQIGTYMLNSGQTPPSYFNVTVLESQDWNYEIYSIITNSSVLTRGVIDSHGLFYQLWWFNNTQEWLSIFNEPNSQCDVYSVCGAYGICDSTNKIICSCIQGFEAASEKDWESNNFNKGCVRKSNLQCGKRNNTHKDRFVKLTNVRLPGNMMRLFLSGEKECESACLKNCSCMAYSYNDGCLIWTGEIRNLQQLHDGGNDSETNLYIRLAAADLPSSVVNSKKVTIGVAIGVTIGAFIIFFFVFSSFRRKWRKVAMQKKVTKNSLVMFSYTELLIVTNNFSQKLGRGGFGSVFKGSLPDLTEVAVKKLEGSNQGEKQFLAEVSTLGAIQHINLVKLRGFCSESNKRLIVYEYMSRGSLDFHLFKKENDDFGWKMRYQVILGIARGLLYLHEECRERIIHCDIKPENILLDSNFCAKVADFGMSKLIDRDFSHVLTTMRGTIGYLAPEWLSGQSVTTKVDVYSFGMMLFEIIRGKRNMIDFRKDDVICYFPSWAAKQIIDDDIIGLLDESLQDLEYDMDELKRVCRIACWCVQYTDIQRPTMSQVVKILEGILEVNIPPMPRGLEHLMQDETLCVNYRSSMSTEE